MGSSDLLQVDPAFWQREEVDRALERRDVGGLFRLLRRFAGASQHRIGAAVDLQQGTVSAIMKGDRVVTSIDVLVRIADGLGMPDGARMRLGLAPKEDIMKRRTVLGIGVMAALTPTMLTTVLHESAAEAAEFIRERGMSTVGAGTLDHLTTVIAELDRSYPWRPSTELFPVARAYRQRVQQLLDGRRTLAEARELHVHGAYLSGILSDLAHDLGSTVAAKAYAVDSFELANQAGHGELCAWAADSLGATMRWTDHSAETAGAAQKGLRRVPRQHPLAARLHARAAQGHARRGDRAACTESLRKARMVCDRLPADMPSRFSKDSAEHVSHSIDVYAAECHVELADWPNAEHHARAAFGVGRWSPGREAGAHLMLGTALAHLGSPDEAAEHGKRALTLSSCKGTTAQRARRLDTALMTRYPDEPTAKAFHDHYQQLAAH